MNSHEIICFSDETKALLRGLIGKKLKRMSYAREDPNSACEYVVFCFECGFFFLRNTFIVQDPDNPYDASAFFFEKTGSESPGEFASFHDKTTVEIDDVVTDVRIFTDHAEWSELGRRWKHTDDFALAFIFRSSALVFALAISYEIINIFDRISDIDNKYPGTARRLMVDPNIDGDADPGEPPADPVYLRTELSLRTGRTVVHEQPEAKK